MTWPVGNGSGGMIVNTNVVGVVFYFKYMRFTADVGALVWRQWGKGCANDFGVLYASNALVANTYSVFSHLWVNVSLATAFMIVFACFFGPVLPRGKLVVGVRFDPWINPLCNRHYWPHTLFLPFVILADLPGSLIDNHHCDGLSNHDDDDDEFICC